MKAEQEAQEFKEISIIFEQQFEAKAFFSVIDKIDSKAINSLKLTNGERAILVRLSDMLTNGEVVI